MGPLYTLSEYLHPNSVNKNSQPSLEDQSSLPMAMTKRNDNGPTVFLYTVQISLEEDLLMSFLGDQSFSLPMEKNGYELEDDEEVTIKDFMDNAKRLINENLKAFEETTMNRDNDFFEKLQNLRNHTYVKRPILEKVNKLKFLKFFRLNYVMTIYQWISNIIIHNTIGETSFSDFFPDEEANVASSPIYLKMNEPQPVRRVALLHREYRLSYNPRAIIVLFASVLRECPVREDVNPILRGGRDLGEASGIGGATLRQQLHLGVIRDIERQERRKAENVYILQQQTELAKELRRQELLRENDT
ncbi:hypothetical protein ALC53_00734 [Atta colombica]|uniref:Uncharacterized protein n=1 Tax=Atta colombica TaxID=520822 RepID=A0A195BW35_9HYME|nr:hypothetical protein ALC53_00734 [Atta colombica]